MLLFLALLWERWEPARTGVEIGSEVGVEVVVIGLPPPLTLPRLPPPLLLTLLPLPLLRLLLRLQLLHVPTLLQPHLLLQEGRASTDLEAEILEVSVGGVED